MQPNHRFSGGEAKKVRGGGGGMSRGLRNKAKAGAAGDLDGP